MVYVISRSRAKDQGIDSIKMLIDIAHNVPPFYTGRFPEDSKLWAALGSFWPAVSPDARHVFADGQ